VSKTVADQIEDVKRGGDKIRRKKRNCDKEKKKNKGKEKNPNIRSRKAQEGRLLMPSKGKRAKLQIFVENKNPSPDQRKPSGGVGNHKERRKGSKVETGANTRSRDLRKRDRKKIDSNPKKKRKNTPNGGVFGEEGIIGGEPRSGQVRKKRTKRGAEPLVHRNTPSAPQDFSIPRKIAKRKGKKTVKY